MEQRVHQFIITRGRKSDINAPICRWYWESLDFSTFSPCPHRRCLKRHKFTKRVAECAVFASSLSWRPAQKQIEIEDEVKSLCIHNKMWILQQACTHYLITCYSCFCLPIMYTPPKWRQLFMYEDDDRRLHEKLNGCPFASNENDDHLENLGRVAQLQLFHAKGPSRCHDLKSKKKHIFSKFVDFYDSSRQDLPINNPSKRRSPA